VYPCFSYLKNTSDAILQSLTAEQPTSDHLNPMPTDALSDDDSDLFPSEEEEDDDYVVTDGKYESNPSLDIVSVY
jgi:hypothetical protein